MLGSRLLLWLLLMGTVGLCPSLRLVLFLEQFHGLVKIVGVRQGVVGIAHAEAHGHQTLHHFVKLGCCLLCTWGGAAGIRGRAPLALGAARWLKLPLLLLLMCPLLLLSGLLLCLRLGGLGPDWLLLLLLLLRRRLLLRL